MTLDLANLITAIYCETVATEWPSLRQPLIDATVLCLLWMVAAEDTFPPNEH